VSTHPVDPLSRLSCNQWWAWSHRRTTIIPATRLEMAKKMTKPHTIDRRFFLYCAWIQLSLLFVSAMRPSTQTNRHDAKVRTSGPGSCFELRLLPPHPDGPRAKSASRTTDPSQASLFEMLSASRTLIFDNLAKRGVWD
jgi:hypothetical protein